MVRRHSGSVVRATSITHQCIDYWTRSVITVNCAVIHWGRRGLLSCVRTHSGLTAGSADGPHPDGQEGGRVVQRVQDPVRQDARQTERLDLPSEGRQAAALTRGRRLCLVCGLGETCITTCKKGQYQL